MIRWIFFAGLIRLRRLRRRLLQPGPEHYRGWHNPFWAFVYYTRTAQVDAAFWETGFLVMAAALCGFALAIRQRIALASLLLWIPLPFYVYSMAYGSVPIFIPQLWPFSYYNSRYGMEVLPALALFAFLAAQWVEGRWGAIAAAGEEVDAAGLSVAGCFERSGDDLSDAAGAEGGVEKLDDANCV